MPASNTLSAAAAARAIESGALTSEQLVRDCLARIAERDADVRAWAHVDADAALARARALDRGPRTGPLHGVPTGFKDVFDTADMPTEYNSPIYRGNRPKWDASCVALVKRAGGIVLGKTVTTEFAYNHPSQTRNPHNLAHTPGGSSAGSGASVGDCMVPLAFGTQTGGSTIRPGAFNGVAAMKPSYNAINRAGLKFVAESLDTVGLYGRAVEDLGLLLHALTGIDRPAPVGDAKPAVALVRTARWNEADASMQARFEEAAGLLGRSGARVADIDLPADFDPIWEDHDVVITYEAARAFEYEWANHRDLISAEVRRNIETGWSHPRARYELAQRRALTYRRRIGELFRLFDFVLTLAAPGEAPKGFATTGSAVFNRPWTLVGVPCVNVPAGRGPTGLPLGVQVIGPYGGDTRTLGWAGWVEARLAGTFG
jgi:Asp-tRNA(Asn)/Glu-tRNA(Gln) amidotransferase A subunit family amidase